MFDDSCTSVVTIASRGWGSHPKSYYHSQVHEYVLTRPNLQERKLSTFQPVSKILPAVSLAGASNIPLRFCEKFIFLEVFVSLNVFLIFLDDVFCTTLVNP